MNSPPPSIGWPHRPKQKVTHGKTLNRFWMANSFRMRFELHLILKRTFERGPDFLPSSKNTHPKIICSGRLSLGRQCTTPQTLSKSSSTPFRRHFGFLSLHFVHRRALSPSIQSKSIFAKPFLSNIPVFKISHHPFRFRLKGSNNSRNGNEYRNYLSKRKPKP